MTTEIKDGDPIEAPVSLNEKREIQEAVKRSELWELAGFPTSKGYMPESEYIRTYKERVFFVDAKTASEVQLLQKFLICPQCREDKDDGRVLATKLYITIEDDAMTVFPAVGHFSCHACGFDEWHPIKSDPRLEELNQARQIDKMRALGQMYGYGPRSLSQPPGQYLNQSSQQIANQMAQAAAQLNLNPNIVRGNMLHERIAKGITPGMGPIYGMTDEEKEALTRLYQQSQNKKTAPPPKIIETPEEAAMVAKMEPVTKRQWIIQKLRDLGHL